MNIDIERVLLKTDFAGCIKELLETMKASCDSKGLADFNDDNLYDNAREAFRCCEYVNEMARKEHDKENELDSYEDAIERVMSEIDDELDDSDRQQILDEARMSIAEYNEEYIAEYNAE